MTQLSQLWARLTVAACGVLAACLLALATFVHPAPAEPPVPAEAVVVSEWEEEEEAEAEAVEGDDKEEAEEDEWEEGEEEDFEGEGVLLPPDCLLRSVAAKAAVAAPRGTVALNIRYSTTEPTAANVSYWLKGGKGSLQLGESKRQLGRQGTLRVNEHVSDRAMDKVQAARVFIVRIEIPGAPSYCDQHSTLRLDAKRMQGSRATWSESQRRNRARGSNG